MLKTYDLIGLLLVSVMTLGPLASGAGFIG
jgi:hypothetical protein